MSPAPRSAVDAALTLAFREEWGRVVATLIRLTGDWTIAEESAQEAFATASSTWQRDGVPERPGAWLTTTARNRALDRLRRASTERRVLREVVAGADETVASPAEDWSGTRLEDERLRLIFTCAHPAIALESRVALTLRTLCGLTIGEIARAFGVSEAAMTKRLVRTRAKIKNARIPYRVPPDHALPERLGGVLAVLYLLYSEGYAASAGEALLREQVSAEAIRLTRLLADHMPDEPEVLGLLALELLHDARRAARVDDDGRLVTLEDQDRSRWDASQIAEGIEVLDAARRRAGIRGYYRVQAAIAALHATAPSADATDWEQITLLYDELARIAPSPYVELNSAIALAMASGPDVGLERLDALAASGALDGYHLLPATQADLLRRAGRPAAAAAAYRAALALVVNDTERDYLARRLAEVADAPPGGS